MGVINHGLEIPEGNGGFHGKIIGENRGHTTNKWRFEWENHLSIAHCHISLQKGIYRISNDSNGWLMAKSMSENFPTGILTDAFSGDMVTL